jgi:ABC-type nitrate/sulfonate/bicarbonate transport system ATPase subunit
MKLSYIPTALKAVNVNFIADVAVKTKGKLNAVAPATSGVSADVSAILQSPLLLSWKRSWNASLGSGWSVGF